MKHLTIIAAFVFLSTASTGCMSISPPRSPLQATVWSHGKSMLPTFAETSLQTYSLFADYDLLREGDVVLYYDRLRHIYVGHRLVMRNGRGWVTQGDNREVCPQLDPDVVTRSNYIGVLVTEDELARRRKTNSR